MFNNRKAVKVMVTVLCVLLAVALLATSVLPILTYVFS